jgi:uncharacterized membrane protein
MAEPADTAHLAQPPTGLDQRAPGHRGLHPGRAKLLRHYVQTIHRAFAEFLTIPTIVTASFLLLAVVTYLFDRARSTEQGPTAGLLSSILFSDSQSVSSLLRVIAAGIITLTSITFALLLLAVQQGAAALTSQVLDQFLRRRPNQFYFGFFVGLVLYTLIILATSSPTHNPVYGVTIALFMTVVTLYLLILLIYTTVDQMRPVMIIQAIRDHTLAARAAQLPLLRRTRRSTAALRPIVVPVAADASGFLVRVHLGILEKALEAAAGEVEIVIAASIGDYITLHDVLAEIRGGNAGDASSLEQAVRAALVLEEQRDLATDPAFGIEQLVTIGWTSISTAKSYPEPGLLVCRSLRYILAHWFEPDDRAAGAAADGAVDLRGHAPNQAAAPIVYRDNVPEQVMKAFESLAVVASESMQHQTLAEILRTFAVMFGRLPPPLQERSEDLLLRSLSALGEHVPTTDLDESLSDVINALTAERRNRTSLAMAEAQRQLRSNIGRLNSRSTRATLGNPAI